MMSVDHKQDSPTAELERDILAAARDERVIQWGWDTQARLLRDNPNAPPIDRVIPGWDSLTLEQQQAIEDIYTAKDYRSTPMYVTESFRKTFEAMLHRVLATSKEYK